MDEPRPVLRSDVVNGTIHAHGVVMLAPLVHDPVGVAERKQRAIPNAFAFQRSLPPLDFAVALRSCSQEFQNVIHLRLGFSSFSCWSFRLRRAAADALPALAALFWL